MENNYRIYFEGLRKVWRNPSLALGSKVLLWDLLQYAGIDGESFPSQKTLAENHGISSRHVRNLLKYLKLMGLVTWLNSGFPSSNKYSFSTEIYCRTDELERKQDSSKRGNTDPLQDGNAFPANEVSEENQISSSKLLNFYEKAIREQLSEREKREFIRFCKGYPIDWIEESIEIAQQSVGDDFNIGYLSKILQDWKEVGKPEPKPIFRACQNNGCESGRVIGEDRIVRWCECRIDHEKKLNLWKKMNR